jgi:hypothetical protein
MAILYVAVLYSTVDVEYFYKTSGNIFPMPHVHCQNIDNGPLCSTEITSVMQVSPSA